MKSSNHLPLYRVNECVALHFCDVTDGEPYQQVDHHHRHQDQKDQYDEEQELVVMHCYVIGIVNVLHKSFVPVYFSRRHEQHGIN